jgi:hypothetical protein
MFGKQLTDKERIELLSKMINNLLPNYQKGDILYYGEDRKEAKFCYFSHNDNGDVFCVLQPLNSTLSDGSHDFFSAFSRPINEVFWTRELL